MRFLTILSFLLHVKGAALFRFCTQRPSSPLHHRFHPVFSKKGLSDSTSGESFSVNRRCVLKTLAPVIGIVYRQDDFASAAIDSISSNELLKFYEKNEHITIPLKWTGAAYVAYYRVNGALFRGESDKINSINHANLNMRFPLSIFFSFSLLSHSVTHTHTHTQSLYLNSNSCMEAVVDSGSPFLMVPGSCDVDTRR